MIQDGKSAKGPTNAFTPSNDFRKDLKHNRVVNEVVCERFILISMPEQKDVKTDAKAGSDKPAKNGKKAVAPDP